MICTSYMNCLKALRIAACAAIHGEVFLKSTMRNNQLILLSKDFAIKVIDVYNLLLKDNKVAPIVGQFLRSGTSIGANVHEANYAASRADFINKLQIAMKECYETDYWLDLFHETHSIDTEKYEELFAACSKIRKLLTASITTAKKNVED